MLSAKLDDYWLGLRLKQVDVPASHLLVSGATVNLESNLPTIDDALETYLNAKGRGKSDLFFSHTRRSIKYLADQLISGVGLNTQFLDSQIAELVMTSMMEDEILALPIHDSFRVRSGYRQWLETTMKAAFEKIVGGLVSVDAVGSRLEKHFGMSKEQFKREDDKQITDPSEDIYSSADLSFETLFKKTLMKSYIGGWETWRSKNT